MLFKVFWDSPRLVFGALGGALGGAFGVSRWQLRFSKLFMWEPLNPDLGPQGALNSPKQLPRDPPGEANGPMKPPNPIRKRIWTCFPKILTLKLMKTRAHESKESKS